MREKKVYTAKEICDVLCRYNYYIEPGEFERMAAGRGRYVIDIQAQMVAERLIYRDIPVDAISHFIKTEMVRKLSEIIPDVWQITCRCQPELDASIITARFACLYDEPQPADADETHKALTSIAGTLKDYQDVMERLFYDQK